MRFAGGMSSTRPRFSDDWWRDNSCSESGNLTDGCTSAGGHFNPFNLTHGAPDAKIRHVGDLGNLQTDSNGNAKTELTVTELTLFGELSIYGYNHFTCQRVL